MPESKTDISGKTWDDLYEDTDYAVLRELASERDDVRGDGSREEICAGLLYSEDRPDAVPEEYQHLLEDSEDDESMTDDESETEADAEAEDDTEDEDDEPEFERASDYIPDRDESFIIKAEPLQEWLKHISTQVDEAKIHLTRDGLQVTAVDPANVGMVETDLFDTAFDSYDVPQEGLIGMNINRFASVLGGADADQLVHITYDATVRKLVVEYGGHEFTLALIDPDSIRQEPDVPDLDLPYKVEIDTDQLQRAMKFADEISDHVKVETDPEGTFMVLADGDTDDYEGTFDEGDDVEIRKRASEPQNGLYSLDYMKDMVEAFESETVTLIHGDEFPIRINGAVEDGDDNEIGHTEYMLAPRIQT